MVDKKSIRGRLRRERLRLGAARAERCASLVDDAVHRFDLLSGRDAVFAYCATDGEVGTAAIIARALRGGLAVGLPVVHGNEMTFVRYHGEDDLVAGRWNIPTPGGAEEIRVTARSIVFLPVVGWDLLGYRLGRGGGYYDRAAREWPETALRVGLAYELQRVDRLPVDEGDVPLHAVLTERRIVDWTGGEAEQFFRKEEADRNGLSVDYRHQRRSGGRVCLVDRYAAQAAGRQPATGDRGSTTADR